MIQGDRTAERAHHIDEPLMGFRRFAAGRMLGGVAADKPADLGVKLAHHLA